MSTTNLWGNIVSSAGVFVVTAGLVGTWVNQRVSPIEDRVNAIDRRLDRLDLTVVGLETLIAQHTTDLKIMQKEMDSKLNVELFKTSREGLVKQIEDDKANLVRVVEELSHQIHSLEEKIVSRAENKQHWDIEQADKEDINKRITDLTARLNALTTSVAPVAPGSPR